MGFLVNFIRKGGKGSGNWGHAGRPGKVGGSAKRNSTGNIVGNKISPQGKLFGQNKYLDEIKITQAEIDFAVLFSGGEHGNQSQYKDIMEKYRFAMKHEVGGGDGQAERETAILMASMGITANEAGRILALRYEMDDMYDDNTLVGFFSMLHDYELDDMTLSDFDDLTWVYEFEPGFEGLNVYQALREWGGEDYPGSGVAAARDYVENIFTHEYSNGFSTRADTLGANYDSYGEGGFKVEGTVLKDGKPVGTFTRTMSGNEGYVDNITHDYFLLDRSVRGQGFGAEYYQHLEQEYADRGVSGISIHADIDVGGYAWARMGYDFANDHTAKEFTRQFKSNFAYDFGYVPDDPEDVSSTDEWHAWDIASYLSPDGERYGKDFMLGSNWQAYKELDEGWGGSDGVEVGNMYYEAKKAEKDMQ